MDPVNVKFWGVRGSIASPLTHTDVAAKILEAVTEYRRAGSPDLDQFVKEYTNSKPMTFGGNTSCVSVRFGNDIFVLDMGTGARPLGNSLFPEMIKQGGLRVNILLGHVHWDHIQGIPFFGPIYVNRETGINNSWTFYGGTNWQKTAEICMDHQFDPPTFPVSFDEIRRTTYEMVFHDVYDRMPVRTSSTGMSLEFGKLNHPQETYGVRMVTPDHRVVTYTTDNEPFDPEFPDPRLVRLAQDADLWITDCQYTRKQYNGIVGGVPRHGWGHSYPEAVAATAVQASVKTVVLFHHDPMSSDDQITEICKQTEELIVNLGGSSKVLAAYEGLELNV